MRGTTLTSLLSNRDRLGNLLTVTDESGLVPYIGEFEEIIQGADAELKTELMIYSYRLCNIGIRGYTALRMRALITDTLVSTPALVEAFTDPAQKWFVSQADIDDITAFARLAGDEARDLETLAVAVMQSLVNPATADTADALAIVPRTEAAALLILVLACLQGRCNLQLLQSVASRSLRLATAALACCPHCGDCGREFVRDRLTDVENCGNGLHLYWLLSSLGKCVDPKALTHSIFIRLLKQMADDDVGALLKCVPSVDVMTVEMLVEVLGRLQNNEMRREYAGALRGIFERASELGGQVTIPSEYLVRLAYVMC